LSRRIIVGEEARGGVDNLAKLAEREKVSGGGSGQMGTSSLSHEGNDVSGLRSSSFSETIGPVLLMVV
jgi:hypothetical protein